MWLVLRVTTVAMRDEWTRKLRRIAKKIGLAAAALFVAVSAGEARAQTAEQGWLRYPTKVPFDINHLRIRTLGTDPLEQTAVRELKIGFAALGAYSDLGMGNCPNTHLESSCGFIPTNGDWVVGTLAELKAAFPNLTIPSLDEPGSFWISRQRKREEPPLIVIAGHDTAGTIYGAFALLRRLQIRKDLNQLGMQDHPAMPVRWVDEWDNADGSIERGYAGRSIFD